MALNKIGLKDILKIIIAESILEEFDDDSGDEGSPQLVRRIAAAKRLKALRVKKGLDTGSEGMHYTDTPFNKALAPKKVLQKKLRNTKGPLGNSISNTLVTKNRGNSSNMTKRLGGKWDGSKTKPMPLNPKGLPGKGKDTSSVRGKTINTSKGNADEIARKTSASDSAFGGLVSKLATAKEIAPEQKNKVLVQKALRRKALVRRAMQLRK
jgi:hypothetical protein